MKLNRTLLTVSLLALWISTPVLADLQAGLDAYAKGDHALAFKHYQEAAEAGNPDAFGKLAGMYLYGLGTERSYSDAYVWFGLATQSGDKFAEKFKWAASSEMTQDEVKQAEERLADYSKRLKD